MPGMTIRGPHTHREARRESPGLGIRNDRASDRPDLGIRCITRDRHRTRHNRLNGPPMALGQMVLEAPGLVAVFTFDAGMPWHELSCIVYATWLGHVASIAVP